MAAFVGMGGCAWRPGSPCICASIVGPLHVSHPGHTT
jgi:hypothetical protein